MGSSRRCGRGAATRLPTAISLGSIEPSLILGEGSGADVDDALAALGQPPAGDLREAVRRLVDDLGSGREVAELAHASRQSRFAVSRWRSGQATPRFPALLAYVDCATDGALDFVAALVDPALLPALAGSWAALGALRRGLVARPTMFVVALAVELAAYRALPAHQPGWIAARVGISDQEEATCTDLLLRAGLAPRRKPAGPCASAIGVGAGA